MNRYRYALGRLKEFAGGYVNTADGVRMESGAGGHFSRNAGKYIGTFLLPGIGTGIGAIIDSSRRKRNIERTLAEQKISAALAKIRAKQY